MFTSSFLFALGLVVGLLFLLFAASFPLRVAKQPTQQPSDQAWFAVVAIMATVIFAVALWFNPDALGKP